MSAGYATPAVTGANRAALPVGNLASAGAPGSAGEPARPAAGVTLESTGGASDRW